MRSAPPTQKGPSAHVARLTQIFLRHAVAMIRMVRKLHAARMSFRANQWPHIRRIPMSAVGHETALRLVDSFEREHPQYAESLNKKALQRLLEQAYAEVLQGDHRAKTEEQLEEEGHAAGIEKSEYEALVNLAVHAATDRPLQK
jgi:hypothetical protein